MTNHEYVQEDETFTVSAERQQHFAIAYTKLSPWPVVLNSRPPLTHTSHSFSPNLPRKLPPKIQNPVDPYTEPSLS